MSILAMLLVPVVWKHLSSLKVFLVVECQDLSHEDPYEEDHLKNHCLSGPAG